MKSNLSVTVIIPVFNAECFILKAVESVLFQSYPVSEIILINDGSTDNTDIELQKIKHTYNIVKVVTTENNGAASARNIGLKIASSDIVAFLDSDDFWMKNKIELQLQFLVENKLDILISSLSLVDIDGANIGYNDNSGDDVIYQILRKKVSMMTPTLLFYRALSKDNNVYFNEKLKHYEDHLFIIELASKGKLGIINKRLVNRRVHDASLSSDFNLDNCRESIFEFESSFKDITFDGINTYQNDLNYFKSHGFFAMAHLCFRRKEKILSLKYAILSIKSQFQIKSLVLIALCLLPFSKIIFNKLSMQNVK